MAAVRARFRDGREHFQHGPIDLVLEAFGAADEVAAAYDQAWTRFAPLLDELVGELPLLRRPVGDEMPQGATARRMWQACRVHRDVFVTPMAAVAGAVADEVLAAMIAGRALDRAYVNDGGDIALHLSPGHAFDSGIVTDLDHPAIDGVATIGFDDPVRGIATSGRGGRSFSLGIADAVTVLAPSAAAADVAATLIGNAVDVEHPAIRRQSAVALDPDSDLGDRQVVTAVGPLDEDSVRQALNNGVACAMRMVRAGQAAGALIALAGRFRIAGVFPLPDAAFPSTALERSR